MDWVWLHVMASEVGLVPGTWTATGASGNRVWYFQLATDVQGVLAGIPSGVVVTEPPPPVEMMPADPAMPVWVVQLKAPLSALSAGDAIDKLTLQVVSGQVRVIRKPGPALVGLVRQLGWVSPAQKVPAYLRQAHSAPYTPAVTAIAEARLHVVAVDLALAAATATERAAAEDEVTTNSERVLFLSPASRAVVLATRAQILGLAALPAVTRIRPFRFPSAASGAAAAVIGLPANRVFGSALVDGTAERVAVIDTGLDVGALADPHDPLHPDLAGRIVGLEVVPIPYGWYPSFDPGAVPDPAPRDGPACDAGESVGHGTHVTGIVVGAGAGSADAKGMAPGARAYVFAVGHRVRWKPAPPAGMNQGWPPADYGLYGLPTGADLLPLLQRALTVGGPTVNLSVVFQADEVPDYTEESQAVDQATWDAREALIVVPAGNYGRAETWPAATPGGSLVAPGTAKNGLTVGATENLHPGLVTRTVGGQAQVTPAWRDDPEAVRRYGYAATLAGGDVADNPDDVAPYSGRGPVLGRIKPDLVAPGNAVLSVRSQAVQDGELTEATGPDAGRYAWMSGTSCSVATVSGVAAIVRRLARIRLGADASGALVKAILVASARRLTPKPDDAAGFGRLAVNTLAGSGKVELLDVAGITSGEVHTYTLNPSATASEVVVVLVWMDAPGDAVVNQLQLVDVTGGGFDPADGDMAGNVRNTVQRLVLVPYGGAPFRIEVRGRSVASHRPYLPHGTPTQDYALVVIGADATRVV